MPIKNMEDEAMRELGVVERIENNVTDMHISQGYIELDASNDEIEIAIKQDNIDRAELLRLAKLGQQMQWVSVAERLPNIMDVVDITYKYGDGKLYRATGVVYDKYEQFGMYKNVTHWMPIPPNPEGVE